MPFQFIQPILHSAPGEARPLKKPQPSKSKRYLELCRVLLKRFPSTTSGRAVEFLVDLCSNTDPGQLYPIPFYSTPGRNDLIVIGQQVLARVAPTVRFEARINRRRWLAKCSFTWFLENGDGEVCCMVSSILCHMIMMKGCYIATEYLLLCLYIETDYVS